MKKKAIEKIPYLTLTKVSRRKGTEYVGVTANKIVGHEKHLFLEIYKNTKDTKDVPVVRIVLTKKDFGNYFPGEDKWTRAKIVPGVWYAASALLWEPTSRRKWDDTKKANILRTSADLDRIKEMCKAKVWDESRWWEYIDRHEDDVETAERFKAEKRRRERRKAALEDRQAHTEKLPEKLILDRADKEYFQEKHYLYYKKRGSFAAVACTKCGGVSEGKWKRGMSYEEQFRKHIEEPREGNYGTCPMCKARGEYKCAGKQKGKHREKKYMFLGQQYKESGLVMRYIQVEKVWRVGFFAGEKEPELYNAEERLEGVEIARAYFEDGKAIQIDYNKNNPYTGKDFWDDCNLYGLAKIGIRDGYILRETYPELQKTMFRYCAMQEYGRKKIMFNPIDYLERYQETPQIEMLVKMGLTGIVDELVRYRYGIVKDPSANRLDEFLGIKKSRVKQLIKERGDIRMLGALQMEHSLEAAWTDEQLEKIAVIGLNVSTIADAMEYMSMQQLLNRIERYAGCTYDAYNGRSLDQLRHIATTYTDYLRMRKARGYDMTNTVYLLPKDLNAAHAKMIEEINREALEKRLAEVMEKYQNIKKNYRRLREKYYYADETMLIRPARSAREIVLEGRTLNHCVGDNMYLDKHNKGKSYILFLRYKSEPDIPYITVEIDANTGIIHQWYGANDKKPDEENMQEWLDGYMQRLRSGELEQAKEERETLRIPAAV